MRGIGAALALGAAFAAAALALSGAAATDPRVPYGFPGAQPSFLGAAVESKRPTRTAGAGAVRAERRWLARREPLGATAPSWARRLYRRSLLVLRAATDPRSGAVVAGARPGWAYVWPRDAAAVALALAAAGYRPEARRIARFLSRLDLEAAARFDRGGEPVPGREAQGDAAGWVEAACAASAGAGGPARHAAEACSTPSTTWHGRADYHEKEPGDYLGNAIAAGVPAPGIRTAFGSPRGLVRSAGDPASGLETAAAWAVRPFSRPALRPLARRTLLRLAATSGAFGLLPSENWDGGDDPWTAPTAWTAWGLAALAREDRGAGAVSVAGRERRAALRLMAALRRAATRNGLLPERVDLETGRPASTTPLAWSHAFAILTLRELWPGRGRS